MGIAMVAMLAFGGTFAYFTATATSKSTSITTGHIQLTSAGELIATASTVMPGDSLLEENSTIAVTPNFSGDTGEYVAVKIEIELTDRDGGPVNLGTLTIEDLVVITMPTGWYLGKDESEGTKVSKVYVWGSAPQGESPAVGSGAAVGLTAEQVVISSIKFVAEDDWKQDSYENDQDNYISDNEFMDAKIKISFQARGMQVKNNENDTTLEVANYLFPAAPATEPEEEPGA